MEFAGIKPEEKAQLERAARMYTNATGEDVTAVVSGIPVQPDAHEAAEAKAAHAEEELKWSAEAQTKLDKARQEERRMKRASDAGFPGSEVQEGNPGPGQPAMATERAKAQGRNRKGEEPSIARPHA
jgi:hypothetical protein